MNKQEFRDSLEFRAPHWKGDHERLVKLNIHDQVKAIMEEYSGGGQWHLMFHLNDGRVLNFATFDGSIKDGDIEISHGKWDSLISFFNPEYESIGGFGWEYAAPNYDERILTWGPGMAGKIKALIETKF